MAGRLTRGGGSGSSTDSSTEDTDQDVRVQSRREVFLERGGDTTTDSSDFDSGSTADNSGTADTGRLTRGGSSGGGSGDGGSPDTGGPVDEGHLTRGGEQTEAVETSDGRRTPAGGQLTSGQEAGNTRDIEQGHVRSLVSDFEEATGIDVPGEGEIATERPEFGDVDFSFGLGGEEDEVEGAASDFVTGTQETFAPAGEFLFGEPEKVIGGFEHSSAIAIGLNKAGFEHLAEDVDTGIRNVGKGIVVGTPTAIAGIPKMGMEVAEIGVEAVTHPGETFSKADEAVAAAAVSGTEGFLRNPGRTTGSLIGGTAIGIGVGRAAGATRLGTGTTGRVLRTADVDPGKIAISGARQASGGARRFLNDDRGQLTLGEVAPGGRKGGGDVETSVDDDLMNREIASTNPEPPDADRGETLEIMRRREIQMTPQERINTGRRTRPSRRYRQENFPDRDTAMDDLRDVAELEAAVRDTQADARVGMSDASGTSAVGGGSGVLAGVSAGDLTGVTVPSTFTEGGRASGTDAVTDSVGIDADVITGVAVDSGPMLDADTTLDEGVDQGITPDTETTPDSDTTPDTDTTPETTPTPDTRLTPEEGLTPELTPDPDPDPDPDPELTPDPDPDPDPDLKLLSGEAKERRRRQSFSLFSREIENPVADPGDVIAGKVDLFEEDL